MGYFACLNLYLDAPPFDSFSSRRICSDDGSCVWVDKSLNVRSDYSPFGRGFGGDAFSQIFSKVPVNYDVMYDPEIAELALSQMLGVLKRSLFYGTAEIRIKIVISRSVATWQSSKINMIYIFILL